MQEKSFTHKHSVQCKKTCTSKHAVQCKKTCTSIKLVCIHGEKKEMRHTSLWEQSQSNNGKQISQSLT